MDFYGFYMGEEFEAWRYLGAQVSSHGTTFRTFAPNALRISLIGDFNQWQETPMEKIYDGNFWEVTVPEAKESMRYKYRIYRQDGSFLDHCDPYGLSSELRPHNASVICSLKHHTFRDQEWMAGRGAAFRQAVNIYELHAGSWRKKGDGSEDWYSYEELAKLLIPWLKKNGYNYVELMPLSEHPSDESWGYQNTGFFAPTSRYGTPRQLQKFVDLCHQNQIGVLLDFVPVHFAVDDYALWNYDGTALYEYPHRDVGRSEWGSCNFMHSRGEVRSFLQSAACYWLEEYHFDGLRMDAVRNLIYWQGQPERGENHPSLQFLRTMNEGLKKRFPDAMLIAEDSTNYPGVTKPVSEGGLGFDYKWDLGWMHDTLCYFQTEPRLRPEHYHELTFSMQYYYQERYLLPLSHDEVVHGKATILQKMYGAYEGKFPQGRAFYLYMMAHPGKKLNFMGNEIGQLREWDEKREQDWCLLDFPIHNAFLRFMREINILYLNTPALYQEDYSPSGFQWLKSDQDGSCCYIFERHCQKQRILFLFQFSDQPYSVSGLSLPGNVRWLEPLINTDWQEYGGQTKKSKAKHCPGKNGFQITLAPFSGQCFKITENES